MAQGPGSRGAEYEECKGNMAVVGPGEFWRSADGLPSKQDYHWSSNAEICYLIGEATGTAMKTLCETKPAK